MKHWEATCAIEVDLCDGFCEISQVKFDGIGDKENIRSNPHDFTCINLHI